MLDAETSTTRRRRNQPQLLAGHAQRVADQWMHGVRALKIRPNRVTPVARIEVRNDAISFNRRGIDPRIVDHVRNDLRRFREFAIGIAITECALVHDIAAELFVQDSRARCERVFDGDDRGLRIVSHFDQSRRHPRRYSGFRR